MSVSINIPKLGMSMVAADLVEWKAGEGAKVEQGTVVLTIETEKVSWDVEAPGTGYLRIMESSGKTVKVGVQVAAIAETKEEYEALAREGEQAAAPQQPAAAVSEVRQEAPAEEPAPAKPVLSSPAARRLAGELGIDLASVKGTGPEGRITEKDVAEAAAKPKATPLAKRIAEAEGVDLSAVNGSGPNGKIAKADVEMAVKMALQQSPAPSGVLRVVPMTGMRKSIADNMYASLHNTAQVTVSAEVDVTESLTFLADAQERFGKNGSLKISFTDVLVMAVSRALRKVPILNSNLTGEGVVLFDNVNLGIAVAVPEGLIVPVLRNAERKGLLEIARESRELAGRAREGRLGMEEVTGGTFTISNVSMFEIDASTPILKPPETGILAAGRIRPKPAVVDGEITVRDIATLSLTFDHRVVDGAEVGDFMGHVGANLSRPTMMLA